MFNIDSLFARNMQFTGSISYDLEKVHGDSVTNTLKLISDNLMVDIHALSACVRVCAAFHEDEGKVLLANVPQRAKSIGEFMLLITPMGTGKSLIFSKIMNIQQLKKGYDLKINEIRRTSTTTDAKNNNNYRHAILNEITGPGLTKYLDIAGNVFVLIDEFDGDHQKLGLYGAETKSNNVNSSAASVLKSLHSGMPFYQKGKVSDSGYIVNPQVSLLAGSNGAPVMDILRSKLRSAVMPDALVMRTVFEVIDAPPKFNSTYKNKFLPNDAIGLELLLLASSLVYNQTYVFDTEGYQSADNLLQIWQDNCVAAANRWKNIDKWVSARFSKTGELTARLSAQIAHIDLSYRLLLDFISANDLKNTNGPVSFDTYSKMIDFFYQRCQPNSDDPIVITSDQVESAIYTTKIILLKFLNLFDLTPNRITAITDIPWIPPSSSSDSNAAIVQMPSTQDNVLQTPVDTFPLDKFQMVLLYPSISFTFTQLVDMYPKLKYRYDSVESILSKLIEMNLLMKIKDGVRSGRNVATLYIKTLPESITMNTVHSFVVNTLDQVKMPWALYKAKCEKVLLSSSSSILSQDVQQIFNQDNYKKIIQEYETAQTKTRKRKQEKSKTPNQHAPNLVHDQLVEAATGIDSASPTLVEYLSDEPIEQEPTGSLNRSVAASSNSPLSSSSCISLSSSSQMLINCLLPRPPPPAMRSMNINTDVHEPTRELESKHKNNDSESPIYGKENQTMSNHAVENIERMQSHIRRSNRTRKKNKRIYSPEPHERLNIAGTKKNKSK